MSSSRLFLTILSSGALDGGMGAFQCLILFYQQHLLMKPLGFPASVKWEEFVFIVAIDFSLLISAQLYRRYQSLRRPASSVQDARLALGVASSARMLFLGPRL